jgi:toxin ParE1/3/4
MTGYVLSPAAGADLEQIWDYTAERWGQEQAERYVRAIRDACPTARRYRNRNSL